MDDSDLPPRNGLSVQKEFTKLDRRLNTGSLSLTSYLKKKDDLLDIWTGPRYIFKDEGDIINLLRHLIAQTNSISIHIVTYMYDPRRAMQLGLWSIGSTEWMPIR